MLYSGRQQHFGHDRDEREATKIVCHGDEEEMLENQFGPEMGLA
jgi:hypothetical protein